MKKVTEILLSGSLLVCFINCTPDPKESIDFLEISEEIEQDLINDILGSWYPKCIDNIHGGYLSAFSPEFKPIPDQRKMIVTQSRHLWTNSKAYLRYSNEVYLDYARHGFNFLSEKMWDKKYGGFYQHVDRAGNPINTGQGKTAYGNAFAIYGLSAYFDTSKDSSALKLAKDTFLWLEHSSHDPEFGGYFQNLKMDGTPINRSDTIPWNSTLGYKDQNSSIHLLEAFTSLYDVWPDSLVRVRLTEMFYLVRDTIVNSHNHMNLFFTPDWQSVSIGNRPRNEILTNIYIDHISFGHDIETAFLLLEASEALDLEVEATLGKTKEMVDFALNNGWDRIRGGLYDGGYRFETGRPVEIVLDSKSWWAQAEALNSLLLFNYHYPGVGYDSLFVHQWEYIKKNLIDNTYGGWYTEGLDTRPDAKEHLKGHIWKSTYHNYRALANCLDMLEEGMKE